jgi:hypothetical protein
VTHLRRHLPLLAGLIAVGLALVLPPPPPRAAPAAAPAGPARLADVWPAARVVSFPALLADGSSYVPLDVLDPGHSVGLATSADLTAVSVVVRTGDARARVLRTLRGANRPTVVALTVVNGQIFWLETATVAEGGHATALWRADLASVDGPATQLAADASDVLYYGSTYDLQVADGRVYWVAAVGADRKVSEVRSVPLAGGPVTVRRLDGLYALTVWPWVTSSAGTRPGDVALLNVNDGERRTVRAGPNEILTCSPNWCRVTTLIDRGKELTFEAERVNGRERQRIGDTALTPQLADVALVDRFEVMASAASANAAGLTQRLWLHDLKQQRAVLLDETASPAVAARGDYLWWSAGDNEAITWQVLDLRTLT